MANDIPNTLGDYLGIVRRRWIYLATILPVALMIAGYFALTLPAVYRSSATLVLEPSQIPEDWIRSTITSYADEQLELVRRRVLTAQNLAPIVDEVDPHPDMPSLTREAKARLIVQNTSTESVDPFTFQPLAESNAVSIHYDNPNPEITVEIARRVADLFLSHTRESRTELATENFQFLQNQSEQAAGEIEDLEHRLAEFKEAYGDALPEARARNQQALERWERELDSIRALLPPANERRSTLEVQLGQTSPNLFDTSGDWRAELATLREDLALARQRYTEDHPDVRRLVRSIEDLNARVNLGSGIDTAPDNPDYIQIRNRLDSVEEEISVLNDRAARASGQIEAYEQRLRIAPEVEREYSQLTREYEFALDRLRGIQGDLGEAALGRDIESEARGDRLTLIRSPRLPESPYSPNRAGIILLGLVLGGALAVGMAALVESTDPTIRSARDLSVITDIKPLAAVPVMPGKRNPRKLFVMWSVGAAVVGGAIVTAVLNFI